MNTKFVALTFVFKIDISGAVVV